MKFTFTEKRMEAGGDLRAYAEKKVGKIDRLFKNDSEAFITFSMERGRFTIELTLSNNGMFYRVRETTRDAFASVDSACAAIERQMFLEELGHTESGLDRMIRCSYDLLGLISFLTCGPDECRAWTIRKGTKAPQAAGKIHSDFERGFIRAEIVAFEDLRSCGSMVTAREKGLIRSEGKEYVMHDGDVTLFRFNV